MKDRILSTSQIYQKLLWNCHIIKEFINKEIIGNTMLYLMLYTYFLQRTPIGGNVLTLFRAAPYINYIFYTHQLVKKNWKDLKNA